MGKTQARDAVFARIAELAPEADAGAVQQLAAAYREVVHGPAGGELRTHAEARTSYTSMNAHHNHQHFDERRQSGVGFGQNGSGPDG